MLAVHNPKDIAHLVDRNIEIPTIPVVASRALRAMRDRNVNAPRLAAILQEDPGLTARILKVANSALYALPREIRNLPQAAMVMGFDGLQSLVLSAACRGIYKNFGETERSMWMHAVACAHAAQALAEAVHAGADDAFVAGLMHDIGRVVMRNDTSTRLDEAIALAPELGQLMAEQKVFGFTHADVGGLLVNRWGLASSLEQAVFMHHDFDLIDTVPEANRPLVYVTALANDLCHDIDDGRLDPAKLAQHPAALELGLDESVLMTVVERVVEHLTPSED